MLCAGPRDAHEARSTNASSSTGPVELVGWRTCGAEGRQGRRTCGAEGMHAWGVRLRRGGTRLRRGTTAEAIDEADGSGS